MANDREAPQVKESDGVEGVSAGVRSCADTTMTAAATDPGCTATDKPPKAGMAVSAGPPEEPPRKSDAH